MSGVLRAADRRTSGAGSRKAIGITTFSGMLLSTIIGIIFVPALYAVFQRIRESIKGRLFKHQQ